MANRCILFFKAILMYWKILFVMIYPVALTPIFLCNNIPAMRCMYVVLLMAAFWVLEALPLAITSLIPMVLFPLMGILDSDKTSICYLKETNMMFIGGLIIAIAVEHCNLHTRVALHVIKLVGCSPRRLMVGLNSVTMFVSMWISNTAATAMMIPIIDATLRELESQGIGEMFEKPTSDEEQPLNKDPNAPADEEIPLDQQVPTKTTMCYFVSTAYAASIGGMGCIVGSGTNLTFKGIYETMFPDSPGINFAHWMMMCVPMMLVMMTVTVVYLQVFFMGLFRPNSADSKKIKVGAEGEKVARQVISTKLTEMGKMKFHEIMVAILFCLSIALWFFRRPQFIPGWAEQVTDFKVKDATPAIFVTILFFLIPAEPSFIYCMSKDDEKRPKKASPGLLTWKVIQAKMHWGLIFLLGGGFALADGAKASGMSELIAEYLRGFGSLPKFAILVIACTFAVVLTQFSSNVAIANVLLPVVGAMSVKIEIHPLYLMLPVSLCCSFAYCLPVSTPPNAIAAAPCNMPSKEMFKAGLGVCVLSLLILFAIFPFLAGTMYDFHHFPEWAKVKTDLKT